MNRIVSIIALLIMHFSEAQLSFEDVTSTLKLGEFDGAHLYGSGASVVDFDDDGDLDIYVLTDEHSRNQMFQNLGDGSFELIQNGLDIAMRSRAAVWFDFNGDHLLDLLVAGDCDGGLSCLDADNLKLFKQLEGGSFEDHTTLSGLLTGENLLGVLGGLAVGDIDNDGWLDLTMTRWGGDQLFFRNKGDGTFLDVTSAMGMTHNARYWQPLIFDLNRDGWADVFYAIDFQENRFFINKRNGNFTESAVTNGLDTDFSDMGVALGDFDADQDFDLYVTNIERDKIKRHNALFRNLGSDQGQFKESAKELSVDAGGWGWGATFVDANNDGFLDLATTNGWHTYRMDSSRFWMNSGSNFIDLSDQVGFNDTLQATTLISFDMDRDGDMDLAQTLKENPGQTTAFRLLENKLSESEEMRNYLVVKPRMTGSNYWAIGATVKVRIGDITQSRPITAGISFYGQEPAEAHFGLGEASEVDEVTIVWPGGAVSSINSVSANQIIVITDENVIHAPGLVAASTTGTSSIELNWGHMKTNATEFVIERSSSESFDEAISMSVSSSSNKFQDEGLNPYEYYYYRIKATNEGLASGWSNTAFARTESDVEIQNPTELKGEVLTVTASYLEWNDNADNEDGYVIQRSLFEEFDAFISFNLPANTATFENVNIEPHTTYYYRVKAYREDGESDFSNKVELTTIVLGFDESEDGISIYPNPTSGSFKINTHTFIDLTYKVSLIDLSGKTITKWNFKNVSELDNYEFNLQVNSGTYLLRIDSELGTQTVRIQKN